MKILGKKWGSWALVILFSVLAMEILVVAPEELDVPKPLVSSREGLHEEARDASQAMTGVHLVETREQAKEWELWAEQAIGFGEREAWALDQIRAIFFSSDGVTFMVTGDTGKVDLVSKNMKVSGNVVTRSSNGYIFKTESIEYDSAKRELYSDSNVFMSGPVDSRGDRLNLTAQKMATDLSKALMRVIENVSGKKQMENDMVLTITSDEAQFSGRSHGARFLRDVVVWLGSMKLSGPEVDLKYDNDAGRFRSLAVNGGVKVSDKDKWATADKLHVDLVQDRFVFSGHPKVVQDNDELQGEEIIFLDGGSKVRINKARAKVDSDHLEHAN